MCCTTGMVLKDDIYLSSFFLFDQKCFKHGVKDLLGNCLVLYSHLRLPHAWPELTAVRFQVARKQLCGVHWV